VTDRLLVDLGADGRMLVSTWLDGELPSPVGEPGEVVWPLDADALEELRWYLEDYLRAPFGVYEERGPKVAAQLRAWGQAVFAAVFGAGPTRDAYVRMRSRAGAGVEIVFRSAAPGWLGLPWELLCDPDRPTPVALDRVGVSRSLPAAALAEAFTVGGERLRVLMVISRPQGAADVGYRMIVRPLLERLEAVRGSVELVVLRPPTLERLAEVLSNARDAGEPFQVVHFDGHGVLNGRGGAGAPLTFEGSTEQGELVFEKPTGGPDHVPVAEVARVLAAAQVPVVVLNACQSGAVGKQLEAAVATRLLQEGAASVVAMAYSVYAVAAAEFMAAFYERLFAGDRISDAVSAGRGRLARHAERPSPKGPMKLADWVVPVHYLRREVRFPDLRATPAAERPVDDSSAALAPVNAFVGRDGLFFTLETALHHQRVVVLHGQAGTGKTELAKAFGRWWRDTSGVDHPEWVIWHSFKPGIASFGLDGVVAEIGLRVFGTDFARLDTAERREAVLQLLAQRRLLLIWDNFEAVWSMPDPTGATPPLDATGREELTWFLRRIAAGGRSAVIVTSRTEETWLGDLRRIPVGGLAPSEAIEYADQVLAAYPDAAPRRAQRAFAELMEWLNGHPLSMRVVLPYLDTTDPQVLLAGLRGTAALPGRDLFTASLTYSIDHLIPETRRLLVVLSLFQNVTELNALNPLSRNPGIPRRFRNQTRDDWERALEEAAGVGLLSPLGRSMYGIHPALPTYLAEQWRLEEPEDYDHQRSATQAALLDAYATIGDWLYQQIHGGDGALAFGVIDHLRRMLGNLLGYALEHGLWARAQAIVIPLRTYWDSRGLTEEALGWVDRARLALETADGTPPAFDDAAGRLWLNIMGCQAYCQLTAHQLDAAERTYLDMQDMLQQQPESPEKLGGLAYVYHHLGWVAQDLGNLDDAKEWYLKSLTINEELGERLRMAANYHHLGWVAEDRGHLNDAEEWHLKSLAIEEELNNRPGIATSYHHLGINAQMRMDPDKAEDWFLKALTINEELGNRLEIALNYNHLGIVAQMREDPDEAEEWYLKFLTISEELGDRPRIATSYYQLGRVAQDRKHLDDAQEWYLKSLTIDEELGNRRGMARSFMKIGWLAGARGHPEEAMEWTVRCVALFDEFPYPPIEPAPTQLAQLTALLGTDALERCWHRVTGKPLPQWSATSSSPNTPRDKEIDPMTDPVEHTARAAAHRLATEHEPGLAADVEAALHARGSNQHPERYLDPISLGSLIVSVATLAWTVYTDLKKKTSTPSPAVIARTIRVQLSNDGKCDPAQQDRIIDIIVDETVQAAIDRN
jgi:tetratricopeptide (TPR) repeat protein